MEQNKYPRNKLMYIQSTNQSTTKEEKISDEEKHLFHIWFGKTGQLHANNEIRTFSYII